MRKLGQTRHEIKDALAKARDPILACSFGKESMLLLYLIREAQPIPLLVFQEWWQDLTFVKRMIEEWKLTAFFYNPLQWDRKNGSIVTWYNLGNRAMPVVTDIVHDDKVCGLDWSKKIRFSPQPAFVWDTVFTGSRLDDTHDLVPNLQMPESIIRPLWGWSESEVWEAINELGVPTDDRVYVDKDENKDPSNFCGCMNCVSDESYVWCPKSSQMIHGLRS